MVEKVSVQMDSQQAADISGLQAPSKDGQTKPEIISSEIMFHVLKETSTTPRTSTLHESHSSLSGATDNSRSGHIASKLGQLADREMNDSSVGAATPLTLLLKDIEDFAEEIPGR